MPDPEETPTDEHPAPAPQPAPAHHGQTAPDEALWLRPSAPPGAWLPPPAPPGGYLGAPLPSQPWSAAPAYGPPPENGKATASLVLGITGLALWFAFGFGLAFIVNLPCSILAWIFGVQGRRRVRAGETPFGDSTAKAGVSLGIIGVILGILGPAGWILLVTA